MPTNYPKFGARFRVSRMKAKLKQSNFKNISIGAISRFELGKTDINISTLYELCLQSNINPNYILGFSKDMFLDDDKKRLERMLLQNIISEIEGDD